MAKAPKLNDLQLILLSTAAQREEGNLLPPSDAAGPDVARVRKAIDSLLKKGLAAEAPTKQLDRVWREGDEQRLTVVITEAGRTAIGVEVDPQEQDRPPASTTATDDAASAPHQTQARPASKKSMLLDMLRRPGGASITELTEALGWLPHTTRAAITGVRKAGHAVATAKVDGATRYSIGAAE
jgi:hypothetical protein